MSKSPIVLKKETRVLGLDSCNPTMTTGAVVRGALFLDGVIRFPGKNPSENLADMIKRTKYFPELRLILLHDPNGRLDSNTLYRSTGLPIVTVTASGQETALPHTNRKENLVRGWKVIGADRVMVEKIRTLTQVKGLLPEPVRIAHLLAKLHIFGKLRQDKG